MEGLDPGLLEHIPEDGAIAGGDRTSIWNNQPHLIAPNNHPGAVKRKEKKRLKVTYIGFR